MEGKTKWDGNRGSREAVQNKAGRTRKVETCCDRIRFWWKERVERKGWKDTGESERERERARIGARACGERDDWLPKAEEADIRPWPPGVRIQGPG